MHIGHLVLGITALAVVLGALLFARQVLSRRPDKRYRGIGIRYLPNSSQPWSDLERCLDAIIYVVSADPKLLPARDALTNFDVEVVPYEGLVATISTPTGYVSLDGRNSLAKPATPESEAVTSKIAGSVRYERPHPFSRMRTTVVVRQLREGDTRLDDLKASGNGAIHPATKSALFHEFAEHVVPFVLSADWNAGHKRTDTRIVHEACKAALELDRRPI